THTRVSPAVVSSATTLPASCFSVCSSTIFSRALTCTSLFPYTTLFRSLGEGVLVRVARADQAVVERDQPQDDDPDDDRADTGDQPQTQCRFHYRSLVRRRCRPRVRGLRNADLNRLRGLLAARGR